jgi:hypothetical protein
MTYLRIFESFKSAKTIWVRKSQIRKSQKLYGLQITNLQIPNFLEGPQIFNKMKFTNLRIRYLWNLFADRPALVNINMSSATSAHFVPLTNPEAQSNELTIGPSGIVSTF